MSVAHITALTTDQIKGDTLSAGAEREGWTDGKRFSTDAGRRYRHVKRGTIYTLPFGRAEAGLQTSEPLHDGDALLVYVDDEGMIWARPPHEFNDGRFEALPASPPRPGGGGDAGPRSQHFDGEGQ